MTKNENKKWWDSLDETWQDQFILNLFASNSFTDLDLASADDLQIIKEHDIILEAIVNLEDVSVLQTTAYDLSPLAYLKKIKEIRIMELIRGKDNVSAILTTTPKHLRSKVKRLHISNTNFGDDLSVFHDFVNLEYLNCDDCGLKSLNGVEKLKKLKLLYLGFNDYCDLNPLRGLNLIEICIGNTQVQDITPLLDIPSLKFVDLTMLDLIGYTQLLALPRLEMVVLDEYTEVNRADLASYLSVKLQCINAKRKSHRKQLRQALNLHTSFLPFLYHFPKFRILSIFKKY